MRRILAVAALALVGCGGSDGDWQAAFGVDAGADAGVLVDADPYDAECRWSCWDDGHGGCMMVRDECGPEVCTPGPKPCNLGQ